MRCLCWKETFDAAGITNGRFVCDRTDPHPSDYGSDSEGHRWVEATDKQWAQVRAATRQAADAR